MKTNAMKTVGRWAARVSFIGLTVFCIYQSQEKIQEQYHDLSLVTIQYQPGPMSDLR